MSKRFLTPIDLNKNELQNPVLQNLATAPASPVQGQTYFDTTLLAIRSYNATSGNWENKATDALLLQGQNGAFYLSRANHTGTQLAATISNLQATVLAYTLDTFAPPVASVNFNGQRGINVATPINSTDIANKAYVDLNIQGLSPKPSAQAVTTAALPTNTYSNGSSGVGATITASAAGVLTVDTYTPAVGDVLLIKNEATAANNGLYTLTTLGTASVPFVLTRHVDMDSAQEFGGGFVAVKNTSGSLSNSLWLCEAASSITVGTSAVQFVQLNSATVYTQGNGISISAGVVSAVAAPSGGLVVGATGSALDTTIAVRKYATPVGDGSSTSITVTHNLGTQDVTVALYGASTPFAEVEADVNHSTSNTITLAFATAPTAGQYRCVVHG